MPDERDPINGFEPEPDGEAPGKTAKSAASAEPQDLEWAKSATSWEPMADAAAAANGAGAALDAFGNPDIVLDQDLLAANRIVHPESERAFLDSYNLLRTQVLHRTRPKGHNVIMVTSAVGGEGKSLTALNLAVSISRALDQFALLVEADLRHPALCDTLGIQVEQGLSDHLILDVPVSKLLIRPDLHKLSILPAGRPIRGTTEILDSPQMKALIKEMKDRYPDRYVIFDCPALLEAPDALVFSSFVDGILLVAEAGRTPREKIRKAVELLEGKNIVGLVLNKSHSQEVRS
ncbi:MAG: AAA family ATPase [Desulfovibrionaceae bacterium]